MVTVSLEGAPAGSPTRLRPALLGLLREGRDPGPIL